MWWALLAVEKTLLGPCGCRGRSNRIAVAREPQVVCQASAFTPRFLSFDNDPPLCSERGGFGLTSRHPIKSPAVTDTPLQLKLPQRNRSDFGLRTFQSASFSPR